LTDKRHLPAIVLVEIEALLTTVNISKISVNLRSTDQRHLGSIVLVEIEALLTTVNISEISVNLRSTDQRYPRAIVLVEIEVKLPNINIFRNPCQSVFGRSVSSVFHKKKWTDGKSYLERRKYFFKTKAYFWCKYLKICLQLSHPKTLLA
jgi:hypothetical protein